jgi:hypothetical protein
VRSCWLRQLGRCFGRKAVIEGGMLAYRGLAELGEVTSDLVAEANAELEQKPTSKIDAG